MKEETKKALRAVLEGGQKMPNSVHIAEREKALAALVEELRPLRSCLKLDGLHTLLSREEDSEWLVAVGGGVRVTWDVGGYVVARVSLVDGLPALRTARGGLSAPEAAECVLRLILDRFDKAKLAEFLGVFSKETGPPKPVCDGEWMHVTLPGVTEAVSVLFDWHEEDAPAGQFLIYDAHNDEPVVAVRFLCDGSVEGVLVQSAFVPVIRAEEQSD